MSRGPVLGGGPCIKYFPTNNRALDLRALAAMNAQTNVATKLLKTPIVIDRHAHPITSSFCAARFYLATSFCGVE
jgi:hypothetical protein